MQLPDYREIETTISLSNIKDQIISLLYATGVVHDNEHVIDIEFEDPYFGVHSTVPIKIKLKKHQEVIFKQV